MRRAGSGWQIESVKTIIKKQVGKNDETTAKELQELLDGCGHKHPCYRAAVSVLPFPCLPLCFHASMLACCFCSVVSLLPLRCFELIVQWRQNINFL